MCGILGLSGDYTVFFDEEHDSNIKFKEKFRDALTLLEHRGPDAMGEKLFFDDNVYIGHTRLAIQDLSSAGTQPMASDNKKLFITYNGEIYNFPILKKNLVDLGYSFSSTTDTEVILYLYEEYGLDCFQMLDGIFSLAIYDKKKEIVVVARDGLGIKPLYYYNNKNSFVFGSEIKAILELTGNKNLSLDQKSINRYLTFQWCPGEGTPFQEIKKHNPGELLVIKNGEIINRKTFFELPITKPIKKSSHLKVDEIILGLDANLRKAVHDQMISDAPLGAFLSGGLDSTSIVAFAKEIDPNITCFTIDAQSSANSISKEDDLPFAKAAADYLNVPLEIIKVDPDSIVRNLEKMVWMLDEPLGDPAPLNVLYI